MRIPVRAWCLVAGVTAACGTGGDRANPPPDTLLRKVFAGVPLIPGGAVGNVSGEGDAAQAILRVPRPPDSVATWYRRELLAHDWTIVSDTRARTGTITLHASDPDQRPLWLVIDRDQTPGWTQVTVVGAVPGMRRDTVND